MRFCAFLLIILFTSCKGNKELTPENTVDSESSVQELPDYYFDTLQGIYSGQFGDKEINIRLNYVTEHNAVGYCVVNGLIRNLSGKVEQTQDSVKLVLEEPGDNQYDGTFYLSIHKTNFNVNGKWEPFRLSGSKKVSLKRKILLNYADIDENTPVNDQSFSLFFERGIDSLGSYFFNPDGHVKYEFYDSPDDFETESGTMKIANGSWTLKKGIVTIYWQPNFAFPNLKSQFKLIDLRLESEYISFKLVGEGRTINSSYGTDF